MREIKQKQLIKQRRIKRARAKIFGTETKPRLCVFRSNKHIYAQIIDDEAGCTIVAANDKEVKIDSQNPKLKIQNSKIQIKNKKTEGEKEFLSKKILIAREVGKLIAKKAIEKGVKKIIFDRHGYKYHGAIEAFASGARENGLQF